VSILDNTVGREVAEVVVELLVVEVPELVEEVDPVELALDAELLWTELLELETVDDDVLERDVPEEVLVDELVDDLLVPVDDVVAVPSGHLVRNACHEGYFVLLQISESVLAFEEFL